MGSACSVIPWYPNSAFIDCIKSGSVAVFVAALVACNGAMRLGANIAQVPVYLLANVAATLLAILFLTTALWIS